MGKALRLAQKTPPAKGFATGHSFTGCEEALDAPSLVTGHDFNACPERSRRVPHVADNKSRALAPAARQPELPAALIPPLKTAPPR
jgi:hypothetical protein